MSPRLNRDEQALEELIARSAGLIVVCLTEPHHPGGLLMAERVRELCEARPGVHLLNLGFGAYRRWAHTYRSYGTPSVLIFSKGALRTRLTGVTDPEILLEALESPQSSRSSSHSPLGDNRF